MSKATCSQLLSAADAWQSKLAQASEEHLWKETADQASWSKAAAASEKERRQLFNDMTTAQAERRAAEDGLRQMAHEITTARTALEGQRDEALLRASRAEDALTIAMSENRMLSERLGRTTQQAVDERQRLDAAEKRYGEMITRCDELADHRVRLEHERAQASEAQALALHEKRLVEAQLLEERKVGASTASREAALRNQVEMAERALTFNAAELVSVDRERLSLFGSSIASQMGSPTRVAYPPAPPTPSSGPRGLAEVAVEPAAAAAASPLPPAPTLPTAPLSPHPSQLMPSSTAPFYSPSSLLSPSSRGAAAMAARHLAYLGSSVPTSPAATAGSAVLPASVPLQTSLDVLRSHLDSLRAPESVPASPTLFASASTAPSTLLQAAKGAAAPSTPSRSNAEVVVPATPEASMRAAPSAPASVEMPRRGRGFAHESPL